MVGVNDFAIRRGQNYGTLLIDCETSAPFDLIEGGDASPWPTWLHLGPDTGSRSIRTVSGAEAIILPIAASHW